MEAHDINESHQLVAVARDDIHAHKEFNVKMKIKKNQTKSLNQSRN